MGSIRKKHSESFKAKVAIAAIQGNYTVTELCQQFGLASSQVFKWKKQQRALVIFLLPVALKLALIRIIAASSISK